MPQSENRQLTLWWFGFILGLLALSVIFNLWPPKARYRLTVQGTEVYRLNTVSGAVQACELTEGKHGPELANCSAEGWP